MSVGAMKDKNSKLRNVYEFVYYHALHSTNFRGTIERKKFAKSTSKEHEKGNWYKRTSGFSGLNLFF